MSETDRRIEFLLDKWRVTERDREARLTEILLKTWDVAFEGDIFGNGKVKQVANPDKTMEKLMVGLQALWRAIG